MPVRPLFFVLNGLFLFGSFASLAEDSQPTSTWKAFRGKRVLEFNNLLGVLHEPDGLRIAYKAASGEIVEATGFERLLFVERPQATPTWTPWPTPTPTRTSTFGPSPTATETRTPTRTRTPTATSTPAPATLLVFDPVFFFDDQEFIGKVPRIRFAYRNTLGVAISRVAFRARLLSIGRSVPWVDTSVDWKIPGGIEPGEAGTVTLDLNIFSEWSKIPDREDYFLDLFAILILDSYGEEVPIDLQFAEGRL